MCEMREARDQKKHERQEAEDKKTNETPDAAELQRSGGTERRCGLLWAASLLATRYDMI